MKTYACLLAALLIAGVRVDAQTSTNDPPRLYTLLAGSQLTEDCPLCDRVSVPMPMTGAFAVRFANEDPLYSYYTIENVHFQARSESGQEYLVRGGGTYQFGGHLVVLQDMFLDLEITNGISSTRALCVNEERTGGGRWPEIQISLSQTNGTLSQVYLLTIVAAPALQFRSITADRRSGNVQLDWEEHGAQAQVEWATNVMGPYIPLSGITTELSFTHVGALTNRQAFYRLRRY